MAYKKTAKRTMVTKGKYCTKKDAKQIIKRALKTNLERKWVANLTTETTVSTLLQGDGSNWFAVAAPAQGTSAGQRIGNEIRLQKLVIRASLHNNATISNLVRMVVFYLDDNVAVTSGTDIFAGAAGNPLDFATVTGINTIHYPFNPVKITVLHDQVFNLAKGGEYESTRVIKKSINLRNKKVVFENTTSGVDNQKPNLYIAYWAAEAAEDISTGTTVELSHYSQTFFTDA